MSRSQLADEHEKQGIDAENEAREITEQIDRINAFIESQIKFETKRAKK